jgi:hypothetical protein
MRTPTRLPLLRWEWLAVLALLGAFLSGVPALFAWPAEQILFAPQVYKQVLVEQRVYEQYPAWLGQLVAQGGERLFPGSGENITHLLESSHFQQVLTEVFPASWMRQQAENLVDQFWRYFNLEEDQLHLLVDFRPVKANLSGPGSPQIVSSIVEGLPPCSEEEILAFGLKSLSGESADLPLCRPPDELLGLSNLLVGGVLQGIAGALPDEVDLGTLARTGAGLAGESGGQDWFGWYRVFRLVLPWMPVLALFSLVATALLGLPTYRGSFFWAGLALLLPGISALVIALLGGLWVSQAAPLLVQSLFGDMVVSSVLVQLTGEVFRRFTTASAVFALLVTFLGVLLIAGSLWWKSVRRQ